MVMEAVSAQGTVATVAAMDSTVVVATHLQTIPVQTNVAAVSTVSGATLYKTPVANLSNTLYGLLPGLTVLQGTGEPGYDAASLAIRGLASYNESDYAIFVDGFQSNFSYFQYLSASEIESISVLKDAAALATLGMKGANGALWVTTKRGRIGKPAVTLQARTGFQRPIHINRPLDAYGYASLYNEAYSNDNGRVWQPVYSQADLDAYRSGAGTDVSWHDEVLKEQTPFTTMDASFRGGNDIMRYFVLAGYMKSNGLYDVKNDDTHSNAGLEQYNIRANVDFNAFGIFEGKIDMGGRTEGRRFPNYTGAALWNNLATYPANVYPVQNPNGTWTGTAIHPDNPVASIQTTGYHSTHDRTLQANFSLKEKLDFITPGLYLSQAVSFSTWTRGSYGVTRNYARFLNNQRQTADEDTNFGISDDFGTNQWNHRQWYAEAGYAKEIGAHRIQAVTNYLESTYCIDANNNGLAGINTTYANRHLSAKFHYSYAGRYVAELSGAYSGSDNYAPGNRFGLYPAIGLGWVISNEGFLRGNDRLSLLKIRASAGLSGYDGPIGDQRYRYQRYYAYFNGYPTGNGDPTYNGGMGLAYTPNSQIFAEQSLKYNMGVDAELFRILQFSVDVFVDKRSGIVSPDNSLLAVLGVAPPLRNIGKVTNKGFEATLAYQGAIGQLNYQLQAMAGYATNKIDYMAEIQQPTPGLVRTGRAIWVPYGYQAMGFYDVTDFDANGSLVAGLPVPAFGDVQPGDVRYADRNDDGVVNDLDLAPIGRSFMPTLNYTATVLLGFKGVDLRVLAQGFGGRDISLLESASQTVAFANFGNAHAIANDRWAYFPDQGIDTRAVATYPRLSTVYNNNNYQASSLWIRSANAFRIRNIELGYEIPASALRSVKLDKARVYVNGVNLFTFSSLLETYGLDPETLAGYPALKSFNLGFTVNF